LSIDFPVRRQHPEVAKKSGVDIGQREDLFVQSLARAPVIVVIRQHIGYLRAGSQRREKDQELPG